MYANVPKHTSQNRNKELPILAPGSMWPAGITHDRQGSHTGNYAKRWEWASHGPLRQHGRVPRALLAAKPDLEDCLVYCFSYVKFKTAVLSHTCTHHDGAGGRVGRGRPPEGVGAAICSWAWLGDAWPMACGRVLSPSPRLHTSKGPGTHQHLKPRGTKQRIPRKPLYY